MEAKLDDVLDKGLFRCGCPVTVFAQLAKMNNIEGSSAGRLFQAFRGEKPLPNHTAVLLWKLFREIDSLDKRASPFKLDFSNAEVVNKWLIAAREEGLRLTVERQTETETENTDLNLAE